MNYEETKEGDYSIRTFEDGSKYWLLNGKHHREDGPAVVYDDGSKEWWLNGEKHREDGPAYEGTNGTKLWISNGEYHREDGPAIEYADGTKSWWLNGRLVYSDHENNLKDFPDITEQFKKSIIKYELRRP